MGDGNGVRDGVNVGAIVLVGTGEEVKITVAVGVEKSGVLVAVFVGVEKSVVLVPVIVLVAVMVMPGVLVGTFGTQSS